MQTFGTYPTLEEAKYAYDIGAIICKGKDYRLNYPVSTYMANDVFLPHVLVPEPLRTIIQNHMYGMAEDQTQLWYKRVAGYYKEGKCPFRPPYGPQATTPHAELWAHVVNAAEADKAQLSARSIAIGDADIISHSHGCHKEAATPPVDAAVVQSTNAATCTTAAEAAREEKASVEDRSARIAALLAGTAPEQSFV
jgi:hypothetical protein